MKKKTLNTNGVDGRVASRKPPLSKKNIDACLRFAQDYINKPGGSWKNVLWTDEKQKSNCLS